MGKGRRGWGLRGSAWSEVLFESVSPHQTARSTGNREAGGGGKEGGCGKSEPTQLIFCLINLHFPPLNLPPFFASFTLSHFPFSPTLLCPSAPLQPLSPWTAPPPAACRWSTTQRVALHNRSPLTSAIATSPTLPLYPFPLRVVSSSSTLTHHGQHLLLLLGVGRGCKVRPYRLAQALVHHPLLLRQRLGALCHNT